MVARRNRKYERIGLRYGPLLLIAAILTLTIFVLYVAFTSRPGGFTRETIAYWGNGVTVWSWDRTDNTLIRIDIPLSANVAGSDGYGTYSLDSLWKLGIIEKRGGELFANSLERVLGIPVPWYIGSERGDGATGSQNGSLPIRVRTIWSYMNGQYVTNIPLRLFFAIAWRETLGMFRTVAVFDVANRAMSEQVQPDGTTIEIVDADRWDRMMTNAFENEEIRKEAFGVAIYNTTKEQDLGNRIARLLGHVGVHVVTVGNDEAIPQRCTVTASKERKASRTVRTILSIFDCEFRDSGEEASADITVRFGMGYEQESLLR